MLVERVPLRLYNKTAAGAPVDVSIKFGEKGVQVIQQSDKKQVHLWSWRLIERFWSDDKAAYRSDQLHFKNSEKPLEHLSMVVYGGARFEFDCLDAKELERVFTEQYVHYTHFSACNFDDENAAAQQIQTLHRGNAARKIVQTKRQEKQDADQKVVKIQSLETSLQVARKKSARSKDIMHQVNEDYEQMKDRLEITRNAKERMAEQFVQIQAENVALKAQVQQINERKIQVELEKKKEALQQAENNATQAEKYAIVAAALKQASREAMQAQEKYEATIKRMSSEFNQGKAEMAAQMRESKAAQEQRENVIRQEAFAHEQNALREQQNAHAAQLAHMHAEYSTFENDHHRALMDHKQRLDDHIDALQTAVAERDGIKDGAKMQIQALKKTLEERLQEAQEVHKEELQEVKMRAEMAKEELKAQMQQDMRDSIKREWDRFQELLQQAKVEYERNLAEVQSEMDIKRQPVEKVIRIVRNMTPWEHIHLLEQTQLWTPLSDWSELEALVQQVEEKKLRIFTESAPDADDAAAAVVKAAAAASGGGGRGKDGSGMSQTQYEAKKLILMKASHLKNDGAHASRKAKYLAEELSQIEAQAQRVRATKPPGHGQANWEEQFLGPLTEQKVQLTRDLGAAQAESAAQYARYDAMRAEVHKSATDLLAYVISDYHTNAEILRAQLEPIFSTMQDLTIVEDRETGESKPGPDPSSSRSSQSGQSVGARKFSRAAPISRKKSNAQATKFKSESSQMETEQYRASLKALEEMHKEATGIHEQITWLYETTCSTLRRYYHGPEEPRSRTLHSRKLSRSATKTIAGSQAKATKSKVTSKVKKEAEPTFFV